MKYLPTIQQMIKRDQSLHEVLDDIERDYVLQALQMKDWSPSRAAILLGINISTLHGKLRKYQISLPSRNERP